MGRGTRFLLALSERSYRMALLAYPAPFRRRWQRELTQTFRTECREVASVRPLGLGCYWLHILGDLLRSAASERWLAWAGGGSLSRSGLVVTGLTLVGTGSFCWLCLHTDETGILAMSVLFLAGFLGLARPDQAWFAALILGLGAPLAQIIGHLMSWPVPSPNGPVPNSADWRDVAGACFALVFSGIGAAGGALFRRLFSSARDRDANLPQ